MRSVSQRNPCCVCWFGRNSISLTSGYVDLLDTRIIELPANNSLIQKSSYDIWIGPDAIQEESNCAQWSSTYLEAREIEFLST